MRNFALKFRNMSHTPLIGMTLDELTHVAAECGMPRFAARQMARWLYEKRVTSIDAMTDLSVKARKALAAKYEVGREKPLECVRSSDGTAKYLFRGSEGRNVEAVMIPDRERATLCVSSQAGCRMGCRFCMTGKQGFHGQLSSAQIINQIMSVDEAGDLTNIVFMGMGEPLDNLHELLKTLEIITAPWGMAWSPKRVTVSTVGRIDELRKLLDTTKVHVALSVHTPYASDRLDLMPAQKAWPVDKVIDLIRGYDFAHQRRFSVEYIMWRGKNDSPAHADALARLLKGTSARVNLIRFHAIPGFEGRTADERTMTAFRDRLNNLGLTATIRASRGEDIFAACGMLAGRDAAAMPMTK